MAKDGSKLPGGVEIHSGQLRGVLSDGMLCSFKELGLDQRDFPTAYENGILTLNLPKVEPAKALEPRKIAIN